MESYINVNDVYFLYFLCILYTSRLLWLTVWVLCKLNFIVPLKVPCYTVTHGEHDTYYEAILYNYTLCHDYITRCLHFMKVSQWIQEPLAQTCLFVLILMHFVKPISNIQQFWNCDSFWREKKCRMLTIHNSSLDHMWEMLKCLISDVHYLQLLL